MVVLSSAARISKAIGLTSVAAGPSDLGDIMGF
jgi:hypothetical protein